MTQTVSDEERKAPDRLSNYETALRSEAKRVIRVFRAFTVPERCNLGWGRRGRRERHADGQFFYAHPDVPHVGFHSRSDAARAALAKAGA
jgi:hypothetical protein